MFDYCTFLLIKYFKLQKPWILCNGHDCLSSPFSIPHAQSTSVICISSSTELLVIYSIGFAIFSFVQFVTIDCYPTFYKTEFLDSTFQVGVQFYTQMQVPIHKEIKKNKELVVVYLLIIRCSSNENNQLQENRHKNFDFRKNKQNPNDKCMLKDF